MNRSTLYRLRSRAFVLANLPAVYREKPLPGIPSPALQSVLDFMEENARPLLEAIESELERLRAASCERCGEMLPESVCSACAVDQYREEMARADGAYEERSIDDACERAAGRED